MVLDGTVCGPTGVQVHLLKKRSELAEVVSTLSSSLVPQVIDALKCNAGRLGHIRHRVRGGGGLRALVREHGLIPDPTPPPFPHMPLLLTLAIIVVVLVILVLLYSLLT